MTWADFYLVCFLVGLLLSVLSLVLGQFDLHFHAGSGLPQLHIGHAGHVGHVAHAGGHGAPVAHGGGHAAASAGAEISPFNFATIAAFLAWFGGAGYLFTRYSTFWAFTALGLAIAFGLAGGAVVFWFLAKLMSREENLDPADYEMVGALGRVVSAIRAGGTGEIVYVQGGTRHTTGARSEDGQAVAKDAEVVVTRYEKGIAYVRRWEELAEEGEAAASKE